MKWIVRVYSLVLLGYTAWRTFDFLTLQLPSGDLSVWLSLAFLFASEAGLVLWHEISLNHSTTREQHMLSIALTWIDFVASVAAGTADMILRQTMIEGYVIPPLMAQVLIYGLPAVMAGNVAGVLVYFSNDAETQIKRAKSELRFETFRQALEDLHDQQGQVAASLRKDIARQLRDDVTGRMIREYLQEPKTEIQEEARKGRIKQAVEAIRGNGNHPAEIRSYNAEATTNRPNDQEGLL